MEPNLQSVVVISSEDLKSIKLQYDLIQQQEHIVNSLKESFARYVYSHYGVDMKDASMQWVLDMDRGTFTPGVQNDRAD